MAPLQGEHANIAMPLMVWLYSHLSILLQLIGFILISSSLLGKERLDRWERSLLAYLRVRQSITSLLRQLRVILPITSLLVEPLALMAFFAGLLSVFVVWPLIYYFKWEWHFLIRHPAMSRPVGSLTMYVIVIAIIISLLSLELSAALGARLAHIAAWFFYVTLLGPCIALYLIIFFIMSPYLLCDRLSVALTLQRPTFGILGAILTLAGLLLQLFV